MTNAGGLAAVMLPLALLSACRADDPGDDPHSVGSVAYSACIGSLAGSGTQVTAAPCATCTIDDAANAIDGAAETYARIDFNMADPVTYQHPGGVASLRATAQSGVIFPAGSRAGGLLSVTRGADSMVAIQTYLGEQPQETASMPIAPGDAPLFVFETTLPFDGVELQLNDFSMNNGAEFRLHEFCGDA